MTGRSQLREDPRTGRAFQAEGTAGARREQVVQFKKLHERRTGLPRWALGFPCMGVLDDGDSMRGHEFWSQEA